MGTHTDSADVVADPRRFLSHDDPAVRRLAVATLAAAASPAGPELSGALADGDASVRTAAVEALAAAGCDLLAVWPLREDDAPEVREAVAFAAGEIADGHAVDWLVAAATGDPDKLVREAAVAALGAIGDASALPTLLDLVRSAAPQIRRRSVVALTAFDGDDVEAALRAALDDRNPMVREVAEMVVGRPADGLPGCGPAEALLRLDQPQSGAD